MDVVGVEVVPSEIWLEIFRRTPAADLLRLKAVCKSFYVLISDELFVKLHLIISTDPKTPYHKIYDPDKRRMSVWGNEPRFDDWCTHDWSAFNHPQLYHSHCVIDSYHGILLVQICNRVLLCNPITRSYKFLPSIFACWKLGYDDVSEQYKVFGLRRYMDRVLVYVLDLHRDEEDVQSQSPRETTALKFDNSDIVMEGTIIIMESLLVNGNVYWLAITTKDEEEYPGTCIVSVNVTTEEVKTRTCLSTPCLLMPHYLLMEMDNNNVFVANGTFYQLGRSFQHNYFLQLQLWVVEGMFRDKILIMMITAGKDPEQQLLYQYDLSREEFEQVTVAMDDLNIGKETMKHSKSFRLWLSMSIV